MSISLLEQVVAGIAPGLETFTVDQYHRMIETGIIREGTPIELIDGFLVRKDRACKGGDPMSHGTGHAYSVARIQKLDARVEPLGYHLRSQLPVTLGSAQEPEPDGAMVRGQPDDYGLRHPGPSDIAALIEAADSSLDYDRTTKLRLYARAAIPVYWIVNIPDRQVEVYTEPDRREGSYARRTDYRPGESVPLTLPAGEITIPVQELLPK